MSKNLGLRGTQKDLSNRTSGPKCYNINGIWALPIIWVLGPLGKGFRVQGLELRVSGRA